MKFIVQWTMPSATRGRTRSLALLAAVVIIAALMVVPAFSAIVTTGGTVVEVTPPSSVRLGDQTDDVHIVSFDERQSFSLLNPLQVDIGSSDLGPFDRSHQLNPATIPSGTNVSSHLLHADRPGAPADLKLFTGSATFDTDILGVVVLQNSLENSDFLGAPGTLYSVSQDPQLQGLRGLDYVSVASSRDSVALSSDRRTVTVTLETQNLMDEVRVITEGDTTLDVTQMVQPTTLAAGGAASWVISVYNPGPNTAVNAHADFVASNQGYGEVSQFSSSNGSCYFTDDHGGETTSNPECTLGNLAPGQTESASGVLVATGVTAPDTITASAYAYGDNAFGSADPVDVSVVSPADVPPGEASGTAVPGKSFVTVGKVTPDNPIQVKFKLPKRVAAGTTMGASKRHHVQLISFRPALLPHAVTVKGPTVPMSINHSPNEADTFCNGLQCTGDVIHLAPFAHYTDRKRPAKVTIIWDGTLRGNGTASRIYERADAPQSPTRRLDNTCTKSTSGYTNLPCVFSKKIISGGRLQYILLMLSGDPGIARR